MKHWRACLIRGADQNNSGLYRGQKCAIDKGMTSISPDLLKIFNDDSLWTIWWKWNINYRFLLRTRPVFYYRNERMLHMRIWMEQLQINPREFSRVKQYFASRCENNATDVRANLYLIKGEIKSKHISLTLLIYLLIPLAQHCFIRLKREELKKDFRFSKQCSWHT